MYQCVDLVVQYAQENAHTLCDHVAPCLLSIIIEIGFPKLHVYKGGSHLSSLLLLVRYYGAYGRHPASRTVYLYGGLEKVEGLQTSDAESMAPTVERNVYPTNATSLDTFLT